MAWLDDHPPDRSQFRCPRRATPSGVIAVHTAESVMDTVGPDTGAEAVARFIQHRDDPGSYHELCDSDSYVQLVRWSCEAFHDATGTNPHSMGLSFACSYLDWRVMSSARRAAFVERGAQRAAAYARWCRSEHGIAIPARRVSAAQARNREPGFVSHAELDPARRKDPGNAARQFPWTLFLARFATLMAPPPTPTPPFDLGDADMAVLRRAENRKHSVLVLNDKTSPIGVRAWFSEASDEPGDGGIVGDEETELDKGAWRAVVDEWLKAHPGVLIET